MQRIRETSRGLEITQDTDVLTFGYPHEGVLNVGLKESALHEREGSRLFVIDGRDNMRDFGEWLTRLDVSAEEKVLLSSSFEGYTLDSHTAIGCVSAVPRPRGSSLAEFMSEDAENAEIGTDLIEDLSVVIGAVKEILGDRHPLRTRVQEEAFAYPLGTPDGMSPLMLARQTYNQLTLQFDEVLTHEPLPVEAAQKFGGWVVSGLGSIKNKSVWG